MVTKEGLARMTDQGQNRDDAKTPPKALMDGDFKEAGMAGPPAIPVCKIASAATTAERGPQHECLLPHGSFRPPQFAGNLPSRNCLGHRL